MQSKRHGTWWQQLASGIPLVNVDAGLLAGEGGKAAAKTTDGSEGERDLTTTLVARSTCLPTPTETRASKRHAAARAAHLALAVNVSRHDTQDVGEGICFKNERHVETGRCGVSCN